MDVGNHVAARGGSSLRACVHFPTVPGYGETDTVADSRFVQFSSLFLWNLKMGEEGRVTSVDWWFLVWIERFFD